MQQLPVAMLQFMLRNYFREGGIVLVNKSNTMQVVELTLKTSNLVTDTIPTL